MANQTTSNHFIGQLIGTVVERGGNAVRETEAGTKILKEMYEQYKNVSSKQTQGRMFEIIETTKFNAAAANKGSELRAIMTEHLGMPHHEADIFIKNASGDVLRRIQAKSSESPAALATYIRNEKYKGMDRLVNSNHKDKVEGLMDQRINKNGVYTNQYKDAQKHLKGEIEHGNVKSGGTTYKEAKYAAENPSNYTRELEKRAVVTGARNAIVGGALVGGVVGMVAEGGRGIFTDEFSVKETLKNGAVSSARGAVISGCAYGMKYLGRNNPIFKGNVAASLASSAVTMTESTYRFLKGKVTTEEYIKEIGSTGVSCLSGIVMTAAGSVMFGPVGGAVAGTIAVMGMQQLYKVFLTAQNDLQLAREERVRAEELASVLIREIEEEQELLVAYYAEYRERLDSLTVLVEAAIQDYTLTSMAVQSISEKLDIKIEHENIDQFNDFMMSDEELIL